MVQIPADQVVEAVRALRLAGQWGVAGRLLAAAVADDPADRAALAMAGADLAVDGDFWQHTSTAGAALERAGQAVAEAGLGTTAAALAFDLELLLLRQDYFAELFGPDGPRFGPAGRDPAVTGELASRARRLTETAPSRQQGGAATFVAGLVQDNLAGDPAAARPLFTEAVMAGEQSGDDLLTSEALRHLGYLNDQDGDRELARQQWQRATVARQRAGCVPLTLAQQLLIAEMTVQEDPAAALPAVAEIRRWAEALGLHVLTAQADALTADAGWMAPAAPADTAALG